MLSTFNVKALTQSMSTKETFDNNVVDALTKLAEDVIDDVVMLACKMAKHRGSRTLDRGDIRFAFEKRFKLRVPTKMHGLKEGSVTVLPQPVASTANYKSCL